MLPCSLVRISSTYEPHWRLLHAFAHKCGPAWLSCDSRSRSNTASCEWSTVPDWAKAAECSNGKRALPTKAAPEAAAAGSKLASGGKGAEKGKGKGSGKGKGIFIHNVQMHEDKPEPVVEKDHGTVSKKKADTQK
ncbi:unnamed protein product, partial [Symbiodinium microadriaticum]